MTAALVAVAALGLLATAVAVREHGRAARSQAELDQLSHYDRLTGLPNRTVLHQALDELLRDARRTKARVAVISIELRGFSTVNETYGHETGDELMAAVAQRLRRAQRSGDRLVRYAGPQFVVMCPEVSDGVRARRRAEEFLSALGTPLQIRDDNIRVTANAGLAISDRSHASAEALVFDATMALRDAEAEGPGAISLHDHSIGRALSPSKAEHRLREALANDEFGLLYLPVVSLPGQEIIGVEALLRWSNPDRGLVNPADFLAALDDTGLIVPVGEWVLAEAARQSAAWSRSFPDRNLTTTVNLSARQLGQADFLDRLTALVDDAGAAPGSLCLEITEGSLVGELDPTWLVLRHAKQAGFRLALDDFGTGHSSLESLRHYALDMLKIDRTFVSHLGESPEDEAIVHHIVGLAHALGMVPVAEGVETPAQVAMLASIGCDAAQGFLFSTPQPAERITELLGDRPVTSGGLIDLAAIESSEVGAPRP
jgi:diguanylate cyclase (GGDEF)-like protein